MPSASVLVPLLPFVITFVGLFYYLRAADAPKARGAQADGPFVAESWLEWEVCRGSTLYRQRFATEEAAARAVKHAARRLDAVLPKYYRDTDWSGNRVWYKYEFEIRYGVRAATEHDNTLSIWSPAMPGTQADRGEHAQAHPLLQSRTDGYTV